MITGQRGRRRLLAGACCWLWGLSAASGALRGGDSAQRPQQQRRLSQYFTPKVNGYPIDYCLRYVESHYGPDHSLVSKRGEGCGKPAADKFCQLQGYPESEYNTAIYYSHNATWVLGDDELNPRDENMAKGDHTWFDRISCFEWQTAPAPSPPAANTSQPAPAVNVSQPAVPAVNNATQSQQTPLPPPAAAAGNATQPKQQQGAGKR